MKDDELIQMDVVYGHVQLVTTAGKDEDGNYCLGGYSIRYDKDGIEVSRTENSWNVRLTCH